MRALTNPDFPVDEELVRYRYELTLDEKRMAAYQATQVPRITGAGLRQLKGACT